MATFSCRVQFLDDRDPFASTSFPEPTRPPSYSFLDNVPLINQIAGIHRLLQAPHRLEDCALQIYRYHSGTQVDFGTYLDLESTLDEQAEELEGFAEQRKNAIILRTQLTVRVHTIIEKLLHSTGRELRRALFSLKQIFQDDKDLVHEFVNNDGLNCLIKVGTESDQNYQNYILRALGQVMLYVDGMEGVIKHNATVQWLYSLLSSKGSLVVKTALKLLLVFVEYTESNVTQLIRAIDAFDSRRGLHPWTNVMSLLNEKDKADSELLIYTMTLINKVLSSVSDQDTFYDLTDCLEELGMDAITRKHMSKQGADLDLITQFQLYESALKYEDEGDSSVIFQVENLRQVPRKKSDSQVRKSKRHEGYQEMTVAQYTSSQPPAQEMPPETFRSRQEQMESFGELPQSYKNEPDDERNQQLTPENTNSQHRIRTSSPQNSRTQRRNRQRSFIEEKHELLALIDKQDQQQTDPYKSASETPTESRTKASQGIPTPFFQVKRQPKVHLQTESIPPSLVPHNEQLHQTGRSRVLPQEISNFNHEQDVSDSGPQTSPVLYVPAHSNKSGSSLNLPVLHFNSDMSEQNSISRLMSSDRSHGTSQHHSQNNGPHHPHFHNHYYHYGNDHSTQDNQVMERQEFSTLGKDFSVSDSNFSNKEPSIGRHGESRFGAFSEVNLSPDSLEARSSTQLEANNADLDATRSNLIQAYNNQWQAVYKQTNQNDNLKSPPSNRTVENGFMVTGEGQVKNMLNKLKNDEAEVPKEAMRPAGDFSGIISNARDNLKRQKSNQQFLATVPAAQLEKKGESDFQWDRIQRRLNRPLKIKDMDFSDLKDEDDVDIFSTPFFIKSGGPSHGDVPPPPPPPPVGGGPPLSPTPGGFPPPPPSLPPSGGRFLPLPTSSSLPPPLGANLKKNKKTVRLHWQALPTDNPHPATKGEMIWKHLFPVTLDTDKLEHLFETKTSELKTKKQDASGKKEITVLEPKRSNAINIGLTVLPPPRTIKSAILKMDNSIMNKEGIEKILTTMIPTEEEKARILEAQMVNPDIPLGTAEQFLLTLSSIFELEARLKLWLFKLDYESSEKELAEPLMDLKKGMAELQRNRTFRCILSGILTIGNFLNGTPVHAFSVEFLQRLPEIKDTVRKQSLIYHLCTLIIEQFPDTTDLYSEIGPITRCSRVDWDELAHKLNKMENDCKSSWDHLQAVVKHDGNSTDLKGKMTSFLADAAERIMILHVIFRRVLSRYNKMLLFFGFPVSDAREMKVNHFCKVISEFALEYRTTRDKVIQMMQKKANQRERKKTRGKMIVDTENFRSKSAVKDDALNTILKTGYAGAEERGLPGRRSRRKLDAQSLGSGGGMATDSDTFDTGEDEILEACVRTAAAPSSRPQRERKRARNQRKSLRRTLKGGLNVEEMQVIEELAGQV